MKRLISHVRLLFNIHIVHLFSNTFETARYNMIIHVIVFLVIFAMTNPYLNIETHTSNSAQNNSILKLQ